MLPAQGDGLVAKLLRRLGGRLVTVTIGGSQARLAQVADTV